MRFVNGTKLDERVVRTDLDPGFKEGRQYGRGRSGGQVFTILEKDCFDTRFAMNIERIMTHHGEVGVKLQNNSKVNDL